MSPKSGTGKYEQLLLKCKSLEAIPTAVAYPCEETALAGAIEAGRKGLIDPILVGPVGKIAGIAKSSGIDLGRTQVIDAPDTGGAASKAVGLVRQGKAELLMKGSLHTDELLAAVVARETGPPGQSCIHHGRANLPQGADCHRRRHQHRADPGG